MHGGCPPSTQAGWSRPPRCGGCVKISLLTRATRGRTPLSSSCFRQRRGGRPGVVACECWPRGRCRAGGGEGRYLGRTATRAATQSPVHPVPRRRAQNRLPGCACRHSARGPQISTHALRTAACAHEYPRSHICNPHDDYMLIRHVSMRALAPQHLRTNGPGVRFVPPPTITC